MENSYKISLQQENFYKNSTQHEKFSQTFHAKSWRNFSKIT